MTRRYLRWRGAPIARCLTYALLGVDVLRDSETGDLFVIECNSVGLTWHLTSAIGTKIQQDFDFDLDVEFGARREAARIRAMPCAPADASNAGFYKS